MPPRASKRGASAKKPSPKAKNATPTPTPKPEIVPLNVIEEEKVSEPEVVPTPSVEVQETPVVNVAGKEEEIKQEVEEVPETKVEEVEEAKVSPIVADDEKVVIKEEISVTTVEIVEETKIIEEAVEEKNADTVMPDPASSNAPDVKKDGERLDEEEDPEEDENVGVDEDENQMNLDQGAKHDVVKEEAATVKVEDTEGCANGDDAAGANESDKEGEGDKSGRDDEDNDEDEDPSVYFQAPLTDRKKQKECEIFVGGLDKEAVEEDLIKVFGEFGEILAARIVKQQNTQKSKGYAFIRYATVEQAKKVLADLKDGTEVRGKRVGVSQSQDNDTLYMGNICKTWTKVNVLETLKGFGIEQIEEIYLSDDPKNEGKSKGFAFLEFSNHSDAMTAYKRLRKPDAVFGCDRSAKVAFAQSSMHPSEEAMSQVKTVFVEGLSVSWDEGKVKDLCNQYGEIERVHLSRNLSKKRRKDFGFVTFTSRESAIACVEGINNSQIGEGDVKVKAEFAKPQNKGRLAKKAARGGFKVKESESIGELTREAGPSNMKESAKSKGPEGKKALPELEGDTGGKPYKSQTSVAKGDKGGKPYKSQTSVSRGAKGGKPYKSQTSVARGQGAGAPSGSGRSNLQRKEQPFKVGKRGRRDIDTGYGERQSKKPRGNMRGRPTNGFSNRMNNSHYEKAMPNYGTPSATYGNPYSQGYAASASGYQGHAYSAVSGSKRHHSDMEPHAGYLEPATVKESRGSYGYGRAVRYGGHGSSSAAAYGARSVLPPSYAYSSYAGYESGGSSAVGGYAYPSTGTYPPRRAYY